MNTEKGQFTVSVQGSGKTLLTPELSGAQFECWGGFAVPGRSRGSRHSDVLSKCPGLKE